MGLRDLLPVSFFRLRLPRVRRFRKGGELYPEQSPFTQAERALDIAYATNVERRPKYEPHDWRQGFDMTNGPRPAASYRGARRNAFHKHRKAKFKTKAPG